MRATILAAILLLAIPARATPSFPAAIQRELGAAQPPACAVCHAGGATGRGTVTTPFGQAMKARGLRAGDESSLVAALGALERDRVDSNGDGVGDVEELRAGRDPNLASGAPRVAYGCSLGAGAAPARARWPLLLLVLLVAALARPWRSAG